MPCCCNSPDLPPEANKAKCLAGVVLGLSIFTTFFIFIPPIWTSGFAGMLGIIATSLIVCCASDKPTQGANHSCQYMGCAVMSAICALLHFIAFCECVSGLLSTGSAAFSLSNMAHSESEQYDEYDDTLREDCLVRCAGDDVCENSCFEMYGHAVVAGVSGAAAGFVGFAAFFVFLLVLLEASLVLLSILLSVASVKARKKIRIKVTAAPAVVVTNTVAAVAMSGPSDFYTLNDAAKAAGSGAPTVVMAVPMGSAA